MTHLYFPDLRKAFHIHMDACWNSIGETLLQQNDNGELCLVTCVSSDWRPSQYFLQPLPLPTVKWQSVSMDWVVGFPDVAYKVGFYNAVLTVADRARIVH